MACALQFIDYSHNMIEEVSASTFMALKSHLQFLDANNNRISRMPVGVFKDLVLVEVCENCVLALLLACVPCSPLRSCWHGCGSPLHSLAGTCAEQPPVVFATVAVLGRAGMCACAATACASIVRQDLTWAARELLAAKARCCLWRRTGAPHLTNWLLLNYHGMHV